MREKHYSLVWYILYTISPKSTSSKSKNESHHQTSSTGRLCSMSFIWMVPHQGLFACSIINNATWDYLLEVGEPVICQCNFVMGVPQDVKQRQSKAFVHPLVDEAKSKDVVSTTPPRSPRSARSSRIQSPSASTKQDVSIATPAAPIHCKMVKVRHLPTSQS